MRVLLESPLVLFCVCFIPIWVFLRKTNPAERTLRTVGANCGIMSVAVFSFLLMLNIFKPGFFWHDEATILSISSAYLHGEPIYHASSAASYYSLLYGPATFLVYVPFLLFYPHPVVGAHVAGAIAGLADLILLYRILRVYVAPSLAKALLPVVTATLLVLYEVLLGTRGDSWLLGCFGLAVWAVFLRRQMLAFTLSGVACGLAIDFKITVFPVVILLIVILCGFHEQDRRRAVLVATLSALTAALALFATSQISLWAYSQRLSFVGRQHLHLSQSVQNLLFASFFSGGAILIPLLGSRAKPHGESKRLIILLYLVALASCVLSGSKDGAGPWHLLPMLPFTLLFMAREVSLRLPSCTPMRTTLSRPGQSGRTLVVVMAISLAATIVTVRYALRTLISMHVESFATGNERQRSAEAEMRSAMKNYPGKNVSMGYGSILADDGSSLRFELPLAGQQYFFDANAVVEGLKENVAIPAGVVSRVNGCSDVWLIPHGEVPFSTSLKDVLPVTGFQYLFPDTIRLGFPATHRLANTGVMYDIWTCKAMI